MKNWKRTSGSRMRSARVRVIPEICMLRQRFDYCFLQTCSCGCVKGLHFFMPHEVLKAPVRTLCL